VSNDFIVVKNFEKFQHYKDRKPPWIKLYRDLLEDDKFFELDDNERYHLIGLFIIASQHDNKIPNKPAWLKHQLRTRSIININKLSDAGWVVLQDASGSLAASNVLAPCKQLDDGETETETEKRREETEGNSAHEETYGEFHRAKLTGEQYAKLQARLNGSLKEYIGRFDRWVNEAPEAKSSGVKRKDRHAYESILAWADRDAKEGKQNGQYKPTTAELNDRGIAEQLHRALAPKIR
jgi:hypothetical protein